MIYWDRENAGEDPADLNPDERYILVCAACGSHLCAEGILYCEDYKTADFKRILLGDYLKAGNKL